MAVDLPRAFVAVSDAIESAGVNPADLLRPEGAQGNAPSARSAPAGSRQRLRGALHERGR
jgi:hypothetical protein